MDNDCQVDPESPATSICFFDLPREIRDIIYTDFLTDEGHDFPRDFENEPDPDHESFSKSWRAEDQYLRDDVLKSHVYIKRSIPMRCAALLRTCRRTRQEVLEHIQEMTDKSSGFTARLDMAFVQQSKGLFLEWTSVPVPFHFIKHVRIRAWGWSDWADLCQQEQRTIPRNPRHRDVRRLAAFAQAERPWLQFVPMVLAAYIVHGPGFTHQNRYPQKLPTMETLTIQHVPPHLQSMPERGFMQIGRSMPAVILSTAELGNYLAGRNYVSSPTRATRVFVDACRDMVAVGALIGRVKTLRVLHEDGKKAREWQTCDMKGTEYVKFGHFRPAARVAVLYRAATEKYAHCCQPQVGEGMLADPVPPVCLPEKTWAISREMAIESTG